MGYFIDINDLDIGQLALDFLNATPVNLLFTGGVIPVLFQVAVMSRGDIVDNRRSHHFGEMLHLLAEQSHPQQSLGSLHYTISLRDWMRRTVVAPQFNA